MIDQPEYMEARELRLGDTYFVVRFLDEQRFVPELRPLVFVGEDLEPGDAGCLYFQDASSYFAGMRYGDSVTIHRVGKQRPFVMTFERALDTLSQCPVNRSKL